MDRPKAHVSQKKKSHKPLLIYVSLIVIVAAFLLDKLSTLAAGFGSIHSVTNVVAEMQGISWNNFYFIFSFLLITSIAGIYYFIKNFNKEKAFFLGLLLPALYLVFSASRFVYFAAIPIITLTGIFLDNKKIIRKKFDIFLFITIILGIVMFFWMFHVFPLFFAPEIQGGLVEANLFLKDKKGVLWLIVAAEDTAINLKEML